MSNEIPNKMEEMQEEIKSIADDFLKHPLHGMRRAYWKTFGLFHCLPYKILYERQYDKIHDDLMNEDKWLLIVLDACRYDYFLEESKRVFNESCYAERVYSSGRNTAEYSRNTWNGDYSNIKYISGATPISSKLSPEGAKNSFHKGFVANEHLDIYDAFEEARDSQTRAVMPEKVRSVAENRLNIYDQMVVHFFQPHSPYIGDEKIVYSPNDTNPPDAYLWNRVRKSEISDKKLRRMYRSNLEYVLEEVVELLESVDDNRRVVITGDHGEMLGESSLYAHDETNHPFLRVVPWMEVDNS